jgi:hypothetical protein
MSSRREVSFGRGGPRVAFYFFQPNFLLSGKLPQHTPNGACIYPVTFSYYLRTLTKLPARDNLLV